MGFWKDVLIEGGKSVADALFESQIHPALTPAYQHLVAEGYMYQSHTGNSVTMKKDGFMFDKVKTVTVDHSGNVFVS